MARSGETSTSKYKQKLLVKMFFVFGCILSQLLDKPIFEWVTGSFECRTETENIF